MTDLPDLDAALLDESGKVERGIPSALFRSNQRLFILALVFAVLSFGSLFTAGLAYRAASENRVSLGGLENNAAHMSCVSALTADVFLAIGYVLDQPPVPAEGRIAATLQVRRLADRLENADRWCPVGKPPRSVPPVTAPPATN